MTHLFGQYDFTIAAAEFVTLTPNDLLLLSLTITTIAVVVLT